MTGDKMSKPILCLDFDGVLHSYTSGWKGPGTVADLPTPGAMELLRNAIDHFAVHIYSSRSSSEEGRTAMQEWVHWHLGECFGREIADAVFGELAFPDHKPSALVTIDDRAIQFDVTLAFKPGNKKNE